MFLKYVCWKLDNRLLLRSSWNFDRSSCGQKTFYHSNDTNKSQTKKNRQCMRCFLEVHAMHRGCIAFWANHKYHLWFCSFHFCIFFFSYFGQFSCVIFFTMCYVHLFIFSCPFALQDKQKIT